ncbi:Uridine kinase [Thalassoglobus neptunius]|uniref:Uridine kinase n=1 Tax=Thalassoglobus neptunius TaxID=1938619 RepID=A0A5C5VRE5_9PLAN|nr:Uridine kinase [Thalassoglobus neptunius]
MQNSLRSRKPTCDCPGSQYESTVRPAHLQFVSPSREFADFVIPGGVGFARSVELAGSLIHSVCDNLRFN